MFCVHWRAALALLLLLCNCYGRKRCNSHRSNVLGFRGGFSTSSLDIASSSSEEDSIETVEIRNSILRKLDGTYFREKEDINGRPHYSRLLGGSSGGGEEAKSSVSPVPDSIHLYWSGSQWVLHHDTDPSRNMENLLGYAKIRVANPKKTSSFWFVKVGKTYESSPRLLILDHEDISTSASSSSSKSSEKEEAFGGKKSTVVPHILGVPSRLFPLYIAFMCDAIAVGLAMPLLPFYIMELGANALQLSLIISSNYIAQMIGCLAIGQISDRYGRKLVLSMALLASFTSYFSISQSTSLIQVALARIIVGSCGGLVPIIQSSVADVTSEADRPKYFARVMAAYGMGFVLGPACSSLLGPAISTQNKLRLASLFPLFGFLIQLLFFRETKEGISSSHRSSKTKSSSIIRVAVKSAPIHPKVLLLLVNGFLLMYAFSIETIYPMFIKDAFNYGERELSTLFACNGVLIGIFQIFLIKPLVNQIGKHWTLIFGNLILALGMVGLALIRKKGIHFTFFVAHIVGYSIADTALASLISKYSSSSSQGRDLAYNQAAQACARVVSPLVAGILYEMSKRGADSNSSLKWRVPVGALPYLLGAFFPAIGTLLPLALYLQSRAKKEKRLAEDRAFEAGSDS